MFVAHILYSLDFIRCCSETTYCCHLITRNGSAMRRRQLNFSNLCISQAVYCSRNNSGKREGCLYISGREPLAELLFSKTNYSNVQAKRTLIHDGPCFYRYALRSLHSVPQRIAGIIFEPVRAPLGTVLPHDSVDK